MMKGIIVYKGKYGATYQYAQSLASTLQLPVILSDNVHGEDLTAYDYIILGSSVYVGKIQLRSWLKKNISFIQDKKLFFFVVCATPTDDKQKLEHISRENIPMEVRNRADVFFLRGRMIKKNLSMKDRFLLKMGSMFAKNPDDKKNMLQDFDAVKIENIVPLVAAVNAYELDKKDAAQIEKLAEKYFYSNRN
jgi:menaquinone-dependent protoporphyrinogen IX oxidase